MDGLQSVLSAIVGASSSGDVLTTLSNLTANSSSPIIASTAATPTTATALPFPTDITALFTFLLSFAALRDWLKFFLLGGLLESARRLFTGLYSQVWESFLLTVEIDSDDPAYDWLHLWLSKQGRWSQARTVELSSRSTGFSQRRGGYGDDEDEDGETKLSLAPSVGSTHTLWYKRRLLRITRTKNQLGDGMVERSLIISIYSRSHTIIPSLIADARSLYTSTLSARISIYVSDQYQNFYLASSRPRRPIGSVIVPPRMKRFLMRDIADFLASEQWYTTRGIPWQRGYLLHGAPGAGKTSLIQALAGHFSGAGGGSGGMSIYVLSLAKKGLDDSNLIELMNGVPRRSIILMEDIDAAFVNAASREEPSESESKDSKNGNSESSNNTTMPSVSASSITLSGLLNAIDGVQAQPGRLIFATTNKYSALDPALIRPGRFDVHVEFRRSSPWQAERLFKQFYPGEGHYYDGDEADDEDLGDEDEEGDEDEDWAVFDATSTSNHPASASDSLSSSSTLVPTPNSSSTPTPLATTSPLPLTSHKRPPPNIPLLAKEFAAQIPPDTLSMAALQGHLMLYKTRPVGAVRSVRAFVEKAVGKEKEAGEKIVEVKELEVKKEAETDAKADSEVTSSTSVDATS